LAWSAFEEEKSRREKSQRIEGEHRGERGQGGKRTYSSGSTVPRILLGTFATESDGIGTLERSSAGLLDLRVAKRRRGQHPIRIDPSTRKTTHHRLELPSTSLALLPPVGVRLANQDDLGHPRHVEVLPHLVVEVGRAEHVAQDGISGLENGTEMSPRVVDDVRVHGSSDGRNLRVGEKEATTLGSLRGVRSGLNVEDDVLGSLGDVDEGGEGSTPVDVGGDVAEGEGDGVDEVDLVAHAMADGELGDVGHGARDLEGEADNVVLADGDDLDRVGQLGVGGGRVDILRDELLRSLRPVIVPGSASVRISTLPRTLLT
jgi:hypothetical protein